MPSLVTSGTPTFSGGKCTIDSTGSDRVQGPASVLRVIQGWIAIRCRFRWAGNTDVAVHRLFSWRDGTPNAIELLFDGAAHLALQGVFAASVDGDNNSYTAAAETDHTLVGVWTEKDLRSSIDAGALLGNANRRFVPNIGSSTFDIFRAAQSAIQWGEGDVWWMAAGSGILSNADVAALHANGNTDPTWDELPKDPTFLWTADDTSFLDASPIPLQQTSSVSAGF